MKKLISLIIITMVLIFACTMVYAEETLIDKVKGIVQSENIQKIKKGITSTAGSIINDLIGCASKIKSKLEEQVINEAKKLNEEDIKQVGEKASENMKKLIDKLKLTVEETPNEVKVLLKLAIAYKLGGEYSLAISVAEKALTLDPNSEEAALVISQCYALKGEAEKGITFLQNFIKEKTNNPKLKAQLAVLKMTIGEKEKAIQDIEVLIKNNPQMIELYQQLGEFYVKDNQKGIKAFFSGEKADFNKYSKVEPIIKNGRTLIPIRIMADNIGAKITYNSQNEKVEIITEDKKIDIFNNKKIAKVNAEEVKMDEPAQIINGRMLIPLRFVCEQLNKKVQWYSYSKYGIISIS